MEFLNQNRGVRYHSAELWRRTFGASMNPNALLNTLNVEQPIIQGPMGGGPSTAELVAAVSNAGGLGSLGAAYLSPGQILEAIQRIRALTSKPFNINLFAGGYSDAVRVDTAPMLALMTQVHQELGLAPPALPPLAKFPFTEQFEAVLEARPPIFSFTFGIPSRDAMRRLKSLGIIILGTATTPEEARLLEQAGVDAVVVQGSEAGAHRGTFAGSFEAAMIPTLELVRQSVAAVSVPVIAAGGLMDGRDVAAALAAGAAAAQLGTAFLTTTESGASELHKRTLLATTKDTTVITRAFSGRPARGLANAFTELLVAQPGTILPFPLQNDLTKAMRAAAAKRGDARYVGLWAGQGVARVRALPAAELVKVLVEEMAVAAH